jgi:hypothetical protein
VVLYTITTIVPGWLSAKSRRYGDKRTPAVCTSLERAREIIENNEGDIFETSYRYAVIETVFPNILYSYFGQKEYRQLWYKWEGSTERGRYVRCRKPREYRKVVGFAIG